MRTFTIILAAALAALSLSACGGAAQASSPDREPARTIRVESYDGELNPIEVALPYAPERLAVLDLPALDILDNLGLGDHVVGVAKGNSVDFLRDYMADDAIRNLGTIKEADLEAIMSAEPDVIFIGSRLAAQYDTLRRIAPVIMLRTDPEAGVLASTRKNAETVATLFGLENEVEAKLAGYVTRIETLKAAAAGQSAVLGITTGGAFNTLGNDGRLSLISREIGFDNLTAADTTASHGNEASFELLVKLNPDYLFILDRDAAIAAEGAQLARDIIENELVKKTAAFQNGRIVNLNQPDIWYTAEGGITALHLMLQDLEGVLLTD